jgi:hypothetical protein
VTPGAIHSLTCNACQASVANNRWAKIRAHEAGWFFAKSGEVYCPAHAPGWVADWRCGKAQR